MLYFSDQSGRAYRNGEGYGRAGDERYTIGTIKEIAK